MSVVDDFKFLGEVLLKVVGCVNLGVGGGCGKGMGRERAGGKFRLR